MSAPRFYFDSAVRKHARELGFALACALVNIPVHAQTHGPTVNISAAPDGASCDPACAEGFACSQGFCVPLETTPEAPTQGSVDAPGLELGADAERQPGSTKPRSSSKSIPRGVPSVDEDYDDDDDDRPKSDDVQEWSDYRHQGFYLRLGLGMGLAWIDGTRRQLENLGLRPASGDATFEGEFSIGGTVGPVAFGYRSVLSVDTALFSGAFIDVHPDPLEGLHLEGSFGIGGPGVDDFTATFGVGHDFFFAREWSFGVTARVMRSFSTAPMSVVSLNASILCH